MVLTVCYLPMIKFLYMYFITRALAYIVTDVRNKIRPDVRNQNSTGRQNAAESMYRLSLLILKVLTFPLPLSSGYMETKRVISSKV